MPAWTDIATGDIDQDSPVDEPLMTALRDNPIAIAEGEPGAPNMYVGLATRSEVGGIGSYAVLRNSNAQLVLQPGDTMAGSTLRYSSTRTFTTITSPVPEGTWRIMGATTANDPIAIWQRIL